jgi:hypothetical protein
MRLVMIVGFAAVLLSGAPAWSIGRDTSAADSPTYLTAVQLITQQRYGEALPLLKRVVAHESENPDALN